VSLLEPKVAQQMAIALSRFKMSSVKIAEALRSGDAAALTAEQLATLIDILPSDEAIEVVQAHEGSAESLGEAERFVQAVGAVPRRAELARAMLTSSTFDEQATPHTTRPTSLCSPFSSHVSRPPFVNTAGGCQHRRWLLDLASTCFVSLFR
jgi:hypothetical protein|tara:strand:+ start:110 stop:565 length:456 start_codon:yes stop_codon:yes gene_type:complete